MIQVMANWVLPHKCVALIVNVRAHTYLALGLIIFINLDLIFHWLNPLDNPVQIIELQPTVIQLLEDPCF